MSIESNVEYLSTSQETYREPRPTSIADVGVRQQLCKSDLVKAISEQIETEKKEQEPSPLIMYKSVTHSEYGNLGMSL